MKAYEWLDADQGLEIHEIEIPENVREAAEAARATIMENIIETNDELMMRYLEDEEISIDELRKAVREATIRGEITPVFCGSALRNKGVQEILDAVVYYLPSPVEVPPIEGFNPDTGEPEVRHPSNDEPFSALVFKIVTDDYVGRLAYFRVYSGTISTGQSIINSTKDRKERIGRILRMHADRREDVETLGAGEIGAVLGVKFTFTGDTLCDADAPIILEAINFPEPVIQLAIEPKTNKDQDKLGNALRALAEEDPTFRVKVDDQTGQTILYGMGELHLEVLVLPARLIA
jgi:elongation factor G